MNITSSVFLFLFIPLALLAYHAAPARLRPWVLVLFSTIFYLWGELLYSVVAVAILCFNYLAARFLEPCVGRTRQSILGGAIVCNLLVLVWFKYSSALQSMGPAIFGQETAFYTDILPNHLPMGISFLVFLAISYLVDVYNQICPASRSFKETALFFLFFPKMTAGPLTRFSDFLGSSVPVSIFSDTFAEGVKRVILGLSRKVLLATPLMKAADSIFSAPAATLDMPTAWFGAMLYALQIYHDFAGYSDMAIGLGLMFGYRLPENFNYPYSALSFTDFWRRWHMTLSSWLRDYLFLPLNRAFMTERFRDRLAHGRATILGRTCFSVCCVFICCGIWHGARWNFVAWGLAHGLFLSFELTPPGKRLSLAPVVVRRCYFLASLALTWVLFRVETFHEILNYLRVMVVPTVSSQSPITLNGELTIVLTFAVFFTVPFGQKAADVLPGKVQDILEFSCYLLMLLLALASVANGSFNPFIYVRF
jgi:alginate O-acetyltransferase complex protein AlgI